MRKAVRLGVSAPRSASVDVRGPPWPPRRHISENYIEVHPQAHVQLQYVRCPMTTVPMELLMPRMMSDAASKYGIGKVEKHITQVQDSVTKAKARVDTIERDMHTIELSIDKLKQRQSTAVDPPATQPRSRRSTRRATAGSGITGTYENETHERADPVIHIRGGSP